MRPSTTPRRRSRALVVLALAAATLAGVAPAEAAPRPEGPSSDAAAPTAATRTLAQPSAALPGLPPVSLALAAVPVDSAAFRRARASYDDVAATFADAQSQRVAIDRALTEIGGQRSRVEADLSAARARRAAITSRLDDVTAAISDLGVALYLSGGSAARIDAALTDEQPSINDVDRRDVLGDASLDVLLAERAAYTARLEQAEARIAEAKTMLGDLRARQAELREQRPAAVDGEAQLAPRVATERVAYEDARVLAKVDGVEFPLVALDAYYRAAAASDEETPACGVRWWAVAGISRVEGHHGTYGGASLDELGDATKRIIGIQLNGTNNTQVVRDTDGGALDGDPAYDRAVGPMQFIPQTWTRFAADGNEDGLATPFNLYDATLAAARYLCRASGGLDEEPGLRAAYFSYNHSVAYVDRVLSFARLYERSVEVPEPRD
jgi:membrane-bound lytic murein transglycosylase B